MEVDEERGEGGGSGGGVEGERDRDRDRRKTRIVAVNFPAYVKNVDKAIDMLGGERALAEALCEATAAGGSSSNSEEKAKKLNLSFEPSDRSLRPVEATAKPANAALFRVEKDKKGWVEPIGQVTKTYSFEALADFYHPCEHVDVHDARNLSEGLGAILDDENDQIKGRNEERDGRLDIIPPIRSRLDAPVDLLLRLQRP